MAIKLERWQTFSMRDQALHIGAAILRAAHMQRKDEEGFQASLKEAIALTKLCTNDPRWRYGYFDPQIVMEELNRFARHERKDAIQKLYDGL